MLPLPLRQTGITNPMAAEMHNWDGSPVSFLRKTELAGVDASLQAHRPTNLWVGAAPVVVACGAECLTTNRWGDGIRTIGDLHGIPPSLTTNPLFGRRALDHGHTSCLTHPPSIHNAQITTAPGSGSIQPGALKPAPTRTPSKLGGQVAPGHPGPLPHGQDATAQGAGGVDRTV